MDTTLDALVGQGSQHDDEDDLYAGSGDAVRFSRPASGALTPRSEAFAPLGGTDVGGWLSVGENRSEGIEASLGEKFSNRAMGASRPASGTATPEYVYFNQPTTSLDNLLSPTFASTGGMSINANGGSRPASGTATPFDYQGGGFFEPTRNNPKGVNHKVAGYNQGTEGMRGGQNPGKGNTRRSRRSRRSRKDKKDNHEGGAEGAGGGGYFQGMKNMFGGGQKTEKNQDAQNSAGAESSGINKHQMKNQGLRGNMNARALKVDQK